MPVYTLWQLVMYILKLGYSGFGGRVALVGYQLFFGLNNIA